jgi:putative sigma-54 modulation protein
MQIRVRADRVAGSTGLTKDAEERLRRAIGRLARRVTRVGVRLFDLNGPRGGVDKACEVTVSLARAGTVRY